MYHYSSSESTPTLTNCTFSGNTADSEGGGIAHAASLSLLTLTNCTFSGNTADSDGGAILNPYVSSPVLTNCILWNNGDGIHGGTPIISHSVIQAGFAAGTPAASVNETVDHDASSSEIHAVPSSGCEFVQWNDGNTDNPRTLTNVTAEEAP